MNHFHATRLAPHVAALLAATLLSACGGGGGGGGGGGASTSGTVPTSPYTPVSTSHPQWGNTAINLSAARTFSLDGTGVNVAVIDAGVQNIPALSANINTTLGRNFIPAINGSAYETGDPTKLGDVSPFHGTTVSSIIAASDATTGFTGVAPRAGIVPIRVVNMYGHGDDNAFKDAMTYLASISASVKILNLSGGWSYDPLMQADIQKVTNAGQLLVAAAGNSSQPDPVWPARYAVEPWANGRILAVGSVDIDNVISPSSHRAGVAKDFYLVAPGYIVDAIDGNGATIKVDGTSYAAPYVSGAAALIKQRWPGLTAEQIAQVLLTTARDLGAAGVDVIYGHGLLDLNAAMHPVGGTLGFTLAGTSFSLASTQLNASPVVASALTHAARNGAFASTAFDSFGRDFPVDLGNAVQSQSTPLTSRLNAFLGDAAQTREARQAGSPFSLGFSNASAFSNVALFNAGEAFAAPTMLRYHLSDANVLSYSPSDTGPTRSDKLSFKSRVGAFTGEIGLIKEHGSLAGSAMDGAFKVGEVVHTLMSVSHDFDAIQGFKPSLKVTLGSMNVGHSDSALSFSNVGEFGFNLLVGRDGLVRPGDRLTFGIVQPLHSTSGTGTFTSQGLMDGKRITTSQRFSMKAIPENDWVATYQTPVAKHFTAALGAAYRQGAPGLGQAELMVGVNGQF